MGRGIMKDLATSTYGLWNSPHLLLNLLSCGSSSFLPYSPWSVVESSLHQVTNCDPIRGPCVSSSGWSVSLSQPWEISRHRWWPHGLTCGVSHNGLSASCIEAREISKTTAGYSFHYEHGEYILPLPVIVLSPCTTWWRKVNIIGHRWSGLARCCEECIDFIVTKLDLVWARIRPSTMGIS
jgi:hypothetical protein